MPVTVALIAEALVTAEEMRRFLDRQGVPAGAIRDEEEDWINDLINAFSLAAARYCKRQFAPERAPAVMPDPPRWPLKTDPLVTSEVKDFTYKGAGFLSFAPYELRSVTSVETGVDLPLSSRSTLFAGDDTREAEYRLEPAEKTSLGTWLYAILPESSLSDSRFGRLAGRRVRVTGAWGAQAVAPDVAHAVKIAVAQGFRNPEGFASRESGGLELDEAAERFVGSLPGESRALLGPYRRTV